MTQTNRESGDTVADLIARYIVRTGLTDAEFGDLVGVHQTQVSRWRRGEGIPRASYVPALAEVLDVDEETVEEARVRGDELRLRLVDERPKTRDPREELRRMRAELRKREAEIARLRKRLGE